VAAGLYVHKYLSTAVGTCTAAFARCMLAGHTQVGWQWQQGLVPAVILCQADQHGCHSSSGAKATAAGP